MSGIMFILPAMRGQFILSVPLNNVQYSNTVEIDSNRLTRIPDIRHE